MRAGALVFLGALALRLAFLQQPQVPLMGDTEDYVEGGRAMAEGRMTNRARNVLATRGPVYPLFVTAHLRLSGGDPAPVRTTQALLGALTALAVYLIGRELSGRTTGLVAGAVVALYPPFVLHTGTFLTEPLALALMWIALAILVRGLGRDHVPLVALSGAVLSLAALARPTLFPALPLFILSALAGERTVPARRRLVRATVFAMTLATPIVAWSLGATRMGLQPVAGGAGLRLYVTKVVGMATHPTMKGWAPDPALPESVDWAGVAQDPLYPIRTGLDLVFNNLWFADNIWRQSFLLQPQQMDVAVRIVFLLGLAGLAFARPARDAPVLAAFLGLLLIGLKWIELRPLTMFVPALALLAGQLVTGVFGLAPEVRRRVLLTGAVLLVLLAATRLAPLAFVLRAPSPRFLGTVGDAAAVVLALAAGLVLFHARRSALGSPRALVVGLGPALLFALLFTSYAAVGSAPRWKSWNVALEGTPVTRLIKPSRPIRIEEQDTVELWLDLEGARGPTPAVAEINGTPLPGPWRRVHCPETVEYRCGIYGLLTNASGRGLAAQPQWWAATVDPGLVSGATEVNLAVRGSGADADLRLGGHFDPVVGPSLSRTSLFRWTVLEDWRFWEPLPLKKVAVSGDQWSGVSRATHASGPLREPFVAAALRDGEARLGVLLVVRRTDGRLVAF